MPWSRRDEPSGRGGEVLRHAGPERLTFAALAAEVLAPALAAPSR